MMIYTHIHAYCYCLLNDMKSSRLSHQHLIYDRMSFAFLNWVILSDSNSHHHGRQLQPEQCRARQELRIDATKETVKRFTFDVMQAISEPSCSFSKCVSCALLFNSSI